jgi:RNA polymerase sigma-70 factor (ECF subfamily)
VPADADDAALVAAMALGDEGAAARVYDRHAALVHAVALRVTGERADAEDVVVECFAQAWRQAARFDGARGSVAVWLAGIARSRALDLVRARGRREARVATDSERIDAAAPALASPSALERLETAERDAHVAAALATLPPVQRDMIALAFWEGLTHAEIAERSGTPLGTVKTRIRLGLQKLRERLAPTPARMES